MEPKESPYCIVSATDSNDDHQPIFGRCQLHFPGETDWIVRDSVEQQHGREIVDEIYLPGDADVDALRKVVDQIAAAQPDVVFSTLIGRAECAFYRRYHEHGIYHAHILVANPTMTEGERV